MSTEEKVEEAKQEVTEKKNEFLEKLEEDGVYVKLYHRHSIAFEG